jgi:hypothetical protein
MGTGAEIFVYAALAATVASTGTAIYSQQQQAKTAENAAAYNNRLAANEAANRANEAAEASRRQRIENRRKLARIRSSLANSGTLTTTGTPLVILGESQSNMELGLADAKRRTDMQAAAMRAQGQMGLWEAGQMSSAARTQSIATGLQGASSLASGYTGAVYSNQVPDTFGLYRTRTVS